MIWQNVHNCRAARLVLEDHLVYVEDVQFTAAVPIGRLGDPLNKRRQLLI